MFFTVIINKEDSWYVAKCIENNVASQGKTRKEALANLKKAIELYPRLSTIEVAKTYENHFF